MSISYGDPSLAMIRSKIAGVDRELAASAPSPALQEAWAKLLEALAIGVAPELRECPQCHEIGMRAASRCSRCWAALAPLPPLATIAAAATVAPAAND